jgi:hypothetical protein
VSTSQFQASADAAAASDASDAAAPARAAAHASLHKSAPMTEASQDSAAQRSQVTDVMQCGQTLAELNAQQSVL